jgi:hypothetical protein
VKRMLLPFFSYRPNNPLILMLSFVSELYTIYIYIGSDIRETLHAASFGINQQTQTRTRESNREITFLVLCGLRSCWIDGNNDVLGRVRANNEANFVQAIQCSGCLSS